MVAAYHLVWTIYGVWLPNDPRGSGSKEILSRFLKELGDIHFGRKKIQPSSSVLRKFYSQAQPKLKHDVLQFSEEYILLVASAFAYTIKERGYTCYGCAIMPDHVHILIRKHRDKAEEMIGYLQDESWKQLTESRKWPSGHPIWGVPGWKVFLNSCADIERTIRYIRENPIKAKLPEQIFDFVQEYDGWLPGVGATRK
jgi:REP element-mobilizing transposase RayT